MACQAQTTLTVTLSRIGVHNTSLVQLMLASNREVCHPLETILWQMWHIKHLQKQMPCKPPTSQMLTNVCVRIYIIHPKPLIRNSSGILSLNSLFNFSKDRTIAERKALWCSKKLLTCPPGTQTISDPGRC